MKLTLARAEVEKIVAERFSNVTRGNRALVRYFDSEGDQIHSFPFATIELINESPDIDLEDI